MENNNNLSDEKIIQLADSLRALAHPTRLQILMRLCKDACNVGSLWQELNISQPLASQHLNKLKQAGILKPKRKGQEICYHLANPKWKDILLSFRDMLP